MNFLPQFAILIVISDAITGASKMSLLSPALANISSAIKLVFLIYLFTVSKKFSKFFMWSILAGIVLFIVKHVYLESPPNAAEMAYLFKLLYPLMICCCLVDFPHEKIIGFFKSMAISYIIVLFASFALQIGATTYDTGTFKGWKGVFFAGNELGLTLLLIFCVLLPATDRGSRIIQVLLFLALLLVGTKTTIFGSVLATLLVIHFTKRNLFKIQLVFPMLVLLGFTVYQFSLSFMGKIVQVQKRTGSDSLLLAIYEKRYIALLRSLDNWQFSSYDLLGLEYSFLRNTRYQAVEMDLFDIFFNSGIFMVALIVLVYFYVSKYLVNLPAKNICYAIGFIICMMHAVFAGHVLYSGMVVVVLGLMMAVIMNQKKSI